jgi:hypothetical protein
VLAEADVLHHGIVKEHHVLKHHGVVRQQGLGINGSNIHAADPDRTGVNVPQPCGKPRAGALAGAGGPNQRSYLVQIVPYWTTFFAFELAILIGWIALILRGTFALKKSWILAAPLVVAGIGYLLELLIPFSFNGFVSGFESFGWIVMFLGGRGLVLREMEK